MIEKDPPSQLRREVVRKGKGWKVVRTDEHQPQGVIGSLKSSFRIEGKVCDAAIMAVFDAEETSDSELNGDCFYSAFDPQMERWLERIHKIAIQRKDEPARKATLVSIAQLKSAKDESRPVESRLHAAFEAGRHYTKALALLHSERDAIHGRKAKMAAQKPRSGRNSDLKETVLEAWQRYRQTHDAGTRAAFIRWLRFRNGADGLSVGPRSVGDDGGQTASFRSVYRWINDTEQKNN